MSDDRPHDYGRYSNGCRCQVCRDAKAAYMANRRAEATRGARLGWAAEGVTHGTRSAYKESGCRCGQCVAVMRRNWRKWSSEQRSREATA